MFNALFNRAPPPPNQSTQNRPLAQTDFLHKVDKMVSHIEDGLMQSQRSAVEGDQIKVPGTSEHVVWTRRVTRPELSRARRQFMVYLKMRGKLPTSGLLFGHFSGTLELQKCQLFEFLSF